jgi:HAD superfamily hydrolase (TIGR01450 family)
VFPEKLDPMNDISVPKGFMFDVDGTLVLGDRHGHGYRVLPGAAEVLEALARQDIPYVLLTNGSNSRPPDQAAKLRAVGLPVADHQMLTPSSVAAEFFHRRGFTRVLVLGTPGVGWALEEQGIEVVRPDGERPDEVQAVYLGWHPDCTMPHIEAAARAIWAGAGLYLASSVPFFATSAGRSIGYSHAIAAAICSLAPTRRIVLGKPSPQALSYVARRLGIRPSELAIVGDDPALEIAMARRAGATGFAVATGLVDRAAWLAQKPERTPHRILDCVGDLLPMLNSDSRAA